MTPFVVLFYALVGTAYGAVFVTGEFDAATQAVVLSCGVATMVVRMGWVQFPRPVVRVGLALTALYMVADLLIFSAGEPALRYLPRMAVYLQLGLLWLPESDASCQASMVVSMALLLAAAALTTSIVFLPFILLYILVATWYLVLLQIRLGIRESDLRKMPDIWTLIDRKFVAATLLLAAAVFSVTVVLFFAIPRYGAGYFFSKGEEPASVSGFTDRVALGSLRELKQRSSVVMRVYLPGLRGPPPLDLRWRGTALDRYDGRGWRRGSTRTSMLTVGTSGFRSRRHRIPAFSLPGTEWLYQEFFLDPEFSGYIFSAGRLRTLQGKFSMLELDVENHTVKVEFPAFTSYHYAARSNIYRPAADKLREQPRLYGSVQRYLQLPEGTERIKALADRVVRGAGNPYDEAVAIARYLKTTYQYSLELEGYSDEHPLDDFLFTVKKGHCEFFASAMAVMLRTRGIPARVVNGYQSGQYSDVGEYFIVRSSDAHSWVEVYFPRYEWVAFDPTPDAGLEDYSAPGLWSRLSLHVDHLRLLWKRSIIEYHLLDQINYLRAAGRFIHDARMGAKRSYKALHSVLFGGAQRFGEEGPPWWTHLIAVFVWVLPFFVLGVPVALALAAVRRRGGGSPGSEPGKIDVGFFLELLETLARAGFKRGPSDTAREFVRRVMMSRRGRFQAAGELAELYYRVRYGRRGLSMEERDRVFQLLRKLREEARSGE